MNLEDMSDSELANLKTSVLINQRKRRIKFLLSLECQCDRYTCGPCHELSSVWHYKHGEPLYKSGDVL